MNPLEAWMLPMLCQKADSIEEFDAATWAAEPKIDGWRAICHVTDTAVRVLGGRNGSDYSGQVPYLEAALRDVLPADSCIDGELMSATGWGGVQGAMTRAGCGDQSIRLVIFDVLRLDGHDTRALPWSDRRRLVERIPIKECGHEDRLGISPAYAPAADLLETVLQVGFEGLVLKRRSSHYVNGRSPSWVKIKPQATAEARVIGFKPGEGSFAGLVGALEFEMLDTGARSRCSGFDMALRREITANPDQWLGQIIEIKHHGIGKEGKPRHPQYLRRRDDRSVTPVTTPVAGPRKNPTRRSDVSNYRMRNYASMRDEKLLKCIEELDARAGDAYERCVSKGGDPQMDSTVAHRIAEERGIA